MDDATQHLKSRVNEKVTVTRGQRLFLAGIAMGLSIVLTTIVLTIRDTIRIPDTDWHSMGGNIQSVLAYLFSQILVAIFTYAVFTAPLVLLFSATAQLKHWYGIVAASLLWVPFVLLFFRAVTLKELWASAMGRDWPIMVFLDFPALLSCLFYLLLLGHARKRSQEVFKRSTAAAR